MIRTILELARIDSPGRPLEWRLEFLLQAAPVREVQIGVGNQGFDGNQLLAPDQDRVGVAVAAWQDVKFQKVCPLSVQRAKQVQEMK